MYSVSSTPIPHYNKFEFFIFKKRILEIKKCLCYTRLRQNDEKCSIQHAENPEMAVSGFSYSVLTKVAYTSTYLGVVAHKLYHINKKHFNRIVFITFKKLFFQHFVFFILRSIKPQYHKHIGSVIGIVTLGQNKSHFLI